ncbi:MAG: GGDEF domain-containing protein [Planctomycetota bacterium]
MRPALLVLGLILVTACRWGDTTDRVTLPATWLFAALLLLAGWTCRRQAALSLTLMSLLVWSWIEATRAAVWTELLAGQFMRLAVALWLVAWMSRLRERLAGAYRLARLDSLTGLPNRQALVEALNAELSRTRRFGRPFTVALLDCDGFKGINDRGGHLAGDDVLRRIGLALRQHTRRYDCVGRLGGDEFLLVLSEVDREDAVLVAERLRAALRHFVEREYPVLTFSLGVVTFRTAELDWDECVQQADDAMYAAKRQGPDQTRFEVVNEPTTRTLPLPK